VKPSIAAICSITIASASVAAQPDLLLVNGTVTDIIPEAVASRPSAEIAPDQSALVSLSQLKWLRFGQIAHRYDIGAIARKANSTKSSQVLQAGPNACLYLVQPSTTQPVRVLPKQPSGFPVCPSKSVDLT
jgi:hypothetical protein